MVRTKAEAKQKKGSTASKVPVKDGGSKKEARTKRKKPGRKALLEIRRYQDCRDKAPSGKKSTKALTDASFKRCVKEILGNFGEVRSISPRAIALLKAASEEHVRTVFALGAGILASRGKQVLRAADMRFANNILTNTHMLNEKHGTERLMTKGADGRYGFRAKPSNPEENAAEGDDAKVGDPMTEDPKGTSANNGGTKGTKAPPKKKISELLKAEARSAVKKSGEKKDKEREDDDGDEDFQDAE